MCQKCEMSRLPAVDSHSTHYTSGSNRTSPWPTSNNVRYVRLVRPISVRPTTAQRPWCAGNHATLVAQESHKPFELISSDVRTKDMHVHTWLTFVADGKLRLARCFICRFNPTYDKAARRADASGAGGSEAVMRCHLAPNLSRL